MSLIFTFQRSCYFFFIFFFFLRSIQSKRPPSWSASENLPLVIPEDLFSSSASEDDGQNDLDGSFSKSLSQLAVPVSYRIAVHAVVFVSHLLPFSLAVPLLNNDFNLFSRLLLLSGSLAIYFACAGLFSALMVAFAFPLFFRRAHWMIGVLLFAKAVAGVCFGLVSKLDAGEWQWDHGALPLLAAAGLIDGSLILAAGFACLEVLCFFLSSTKQQNVQ